MNQRHLNKGFTLAEVLITLLIIGVIASIVIPGLIADSQQAEQKAAFKKTCSTLNSAAKRVASDNGGSLAGLFTTSDTMRNAFLPFLSCIKTCNLGSGNGICHPLETSYKTYYGTPFPIVSTWDAFKGRSVAVLNDGTILGFLIVDGNCTSSRLADNNECGHIQVDINGFKGPNVAGKDFFEFHLARQGYVVPLGSSKDLYKDSYSKAYGFDKALDYLSN